jgi:ABC-type nitrate/sulfonate/bicarbonate transport system substrate-binding protein
MFRLMVADLDSPSYFVAVAAVELGFFKHEGIDIELERTYGAHIGAERLRDGTLHFFGGPAYAATLTFPAWKGAKLLCALSQCSYWFLAVRADLAVERGDLSALKGLRISSSMAAPVLGLRHLLAESGIDFVAGSRSLSGNSAIAARAAVACWRCARRWSAGGSSLGNSSASARGTVRNCRRRSIRNA